MQVKTTKTLIHINQDGFYQKQNKWKKERKKEEKDKKKKETIKCTKDVEKLELLYATSGGKIVQPLYKTV